MIDTVDKFLKIVGWFDGAGHEPAHDPIPNNVGYWSIPSMEDIGQSLCAVCEEPFTHGPMKTLSVRYAEHPKRSYFFRVHDACVLCEEGKGAGKKVLDAVKVFAMEEEVRA